MKWKGAGDVISIMCQLPPFAIVRCILDLHMPHVTGWAICLYCCIDKKREIKLVYSVVEMKSGK